LYFSACIGGDLFSRIECMQKTIHTKTCMAVTVEERKMWEEGRDHAIVIKHVKY
jgi:hypothetical protein